MSYIISKIKIINISVILLLFLLTTNIAFAEDGSHQGGTAISKIPVGARAISMGYAFTAVADDGFAIFSNPAGLGNLNHINIALGYQKLPFDRHVGAFAFSLPPLTEDSHFGFAIGGVGELVNKGLDNRDSTGALLNEDIKNRSMMGVVSVAYRLSALKGSKIGINFKYIREEIGESQANAGSVDIGTIIPLPVIDLGAAVQDIALITKYKDVDDVQFGNPTVKIGISSTPDFSWGRVSLEMQKNIKSNDPVSFFVGGSFFLFKKVIKDTGLPSEIYDNIDTDEEIKDEDEDIEDLDEPDVNVGDMEKKNLTSERIQHALLLNVGFKRDSFTGGITYRYSFFALDVAAIFPSTFNDDFSMLASLNLIF